MSHKYNVFNEYKHFNENILELVLNCLFFSFTEFEQQQILFSGLIGLGSHQTMELSHILPDQCSTEVSGLRKLPY